MVSVLRPGQRIFNIPGIGVQTSRRAVGGGNGLLNALIAYWPGNEASGNLMDAHTNGLTLTDTNTVTSAAGKVYATARQYTAVNGEYHTRDDDALLSGGDVDLTIAAWLFIDNKAQSRSICTKWNYLTGNREYMFLYNSSVDRFQFLVSKDGASGASVASLTADAAGSPATGTWYLIVVQHDAVSNVISIQVDNNTANSQAWTNGIFNGIAPFRVGVYMNESPFSGRIGPVAFWKSAAGAGGVLTAAQRTALYNAGAGLAYSAFTT